MIKNVDMLFAFKNTIPAPPFTPEQMQTQACSSDEVTINHWRKTWVANAKANKERFGSFKDHGVGQLFGLNKHKPCILMGSGPSLKNSIDDSIHPHTGRPKLSLKNTGGVMVISCLHNYHFCIDNNIKVDYFVSLDAGPVTIEEISEGGKLSAEEYLESTKDKTLVAYIGSNPKLIEAWRGRVLFFNVPPANDEVMAEIMAVEEFHTMFSTGGNVLGACMYLAKAILGSNPIIFTGADFCFSYTRKFHAWDSKYDAEIGEAMRCVDVWGNSVLTWGSYWNFKLWFDKTCHTVPGTYINCTEGGLLGSYPEGNIARIQQMTLCDCLDMYDMHNEIRQQCEYPDQLERKVLY